MSVSHHINVVTSLLDAVSASPANALLGFILSSAMFLIDIAGGRVILIFGSGVDYSRSDICW